MPVTVVGFVLGPLLLLFVAVFVLRGKGRQGLLIGFAVLFFLTALYQLIVPMDALRLYTAGSLEVNNLATVAVLLLQRCGTSSLSFHPSSLFSLLHLSWLKHYYPLTNRQFFYSFSMKESCYWFQVRLR